MFVNKFNFVILFLIVNTIHVNQQQQTREVTHLVAIKYQMVDLYGLLMLQLAGIIQQ